MLLYVKTIVCCVQLHCVLYFFMQREIIVCTIFEPKAKKHLPFFSRFVKKSPSFPKVSKCCKMYVTEAKALYLHVVDDNNCSIFFFYSSPCF
jgi:inhibitor of KinA sporulation pathway (predicted exonuclease)